MAKETKIDEQQKIDAEKEAAEILDNFWVSQEQEDYDHDRDMEGWDFANGVRA